MGIEYHYDLIQGTDEWMAVRRGLVTASKMGCLVTPATLKAAKNKDTRALYYDLADQRIYDLPIDDYQSWDMLRGVKEEVIAKDLYSKLYAQVKDCGFITNDDLGFKIGMSPDGLVGEEGGIEIKSRNGKFQIQTAIENEVPAEFMAQIQSFFLVTGRKWCDFISYSNGRHMFVKRVEPIAEWQDAMKEALVIAEEKIEELVLQYRAVSKNLVLAPWNDVMAEERAEIMPSDEQTILDAG